MPPRAPAYQVPPIDAFGDGGFRIGGVRHEGAIALVDGAVRAWPVGEDPKALAVSDFETFLNPDDKPDVVVLGLGAKVVHPPAAVRQAFLDAGVGLEALDTPAACRVYNILAGEARRVWAALIAV
ncbi:hypothetical protein DDZ18_12840 [Marinicauda salina]|uniref:Xcc1710-like domain-containing protein n=1 Tax=Marinicauda salina TaxID=2135793 RepID=A0A2U2BRK3_9PROT|nr:Mth938-like domain-containing protein [Marinicauda salina]PWE16643.1 hypothetical protein DDZ18_12840 [Marinicauda salina]